MKIVLTTGGSGGHIFPALFVAEKLKTKNCDVHFIGAFGSNEERIKQTGFEYINLVGKGLTYSSFLSFFQAVIFMMRAVFLSLGHLKRIKPDVVCGFGGYGSFAVVFAAVLLRYPTIIHEQNVVPGRANRLLAGWVKRIGVSFDKTTELLPRQKTVVVGCPVHNLGHKSRDEILKAFDLSDDKKTILVLGGSQGSQRINEVFLKACALLDGKVNFQVIHVTGQSNYDSIKKKHRRKSINSAVFPFLENIVDAYKVSDLVISRAGAVTITELILFQLPAIIIPYPFAGGHQKQNAEVLADCGLGYIIEDEQLVQESLKNRIVDFFNNSQTTIDLSKCDAVIRKNATELLSTEIIQLGDKIQ